MARILRFSCHRCMAFSFEPKPPSGTRISTMCGKSFSISLALARPLYRLMSGPNTSIERLQVRAFNKRFPEIKVEMVRAPGGQLITRVTTEAAAGKLALHDDARDGEDNWEPYLTQLKASGSFEGGS